MMRARKGFTFIELAVALVLFSIISSSLIIGLAKQRDFRRRGERESIAQILARNEMESLRAAGPRNAHAYVGSRRTNSAGTEVPNGDYTIDIAADTLCLGGMSPAEDASEVLATACANMRNAVLRYSIEISYSTGITRDTMRFQLDLSERNRFGETRAIQ